MATDAAVITATNLANWIPTVWSKDVLADVEKALVTAAHCDRAYEMYSTGGGDTIVVPHLAEISANVVNTSRDMTLYDAVQNVTNISINQKYDIGVIVDDINKVQTMPKYYEKVRTKLSYGLAKQLDINVGALYKGFNNKSGTVNVALTEDVLIEAYENLNGADAPADERAWVFDEASITDLMKLDYFVRMDYIPDSIVKKGFRGREIFGSPVYMTTNLDTYAGGPHAAAYSHKEALALVVQIPPALKVFEVPLQHGWAIKGLVLFGVQEMRGTFGNLINTRS